jgi:hypothetical protein
MERCDECGRFFETKPIGKVHAKGSLEDSVTIPCSGEIRPWKPRIVIVMEGGLITNVLSDFAIEAYSIDYDGKSAPSEETTLIPQNHGSFAVRAFADSQEVKVDSDRVAEIVKAIEAGWESESIEK